MLLSLAAMQDTLPEYNVKGLERKKLTYHDGVYEANKYRIWMLDIWITWDNKSKYPEVANNPVNINRDIVTVYTHRDLHLFKWGEDDNTSWTYWARKSDFIDGYFHNEVSQEVYLQWLESNNVDTANLLNSWELMQYLDQSISLSSMLELISDYSHLKNSHPGIFIVTLNKILLRAKIYDNPELLEKFGDQAPENYTFTSKVIKTALDELKISNSEQYEIIMQSIKFSKNIVKNWDRKKIDFRARNKAHKYYNKDNKQALLLSQELFSKALYNFIIYYLPNILYSDSNIINF